MCTTTGNRRTRYRETGQGVRLIVMQKFTDIDWYYVGPLLCGHDFGEHPEPLHLKRAVLEVLIHG